MEKNKMKNINVSEKLQIINEIKDFLDGYDKELKYLVHVEANPNENFAECFFHYPDGVKEMKKIEYKPFMYIKDLGKNGFTLYNGDKGLLKEKLIQYGIEIKKMKTGNQKRLEDGFCYKVTSYKSYNSIIKFFRDGNLDPYEKLISGEGKPILNSKGEKIFKNRHLFFSVKPFEQFLIYKKTRLYKGFEEYKDIHKVTFDIETTGLRAEISRVFSIGIRDNKGFEAVLEVEKTNDDESEINLILDFFNLISELNPAVVCGFNSEEFDFEYLTKRLKILINDDDKINNIFTELIRLKRKPKSSVKIGNSAERYTATQIWGLSVIDILHAVKKIVATNSDLKSSKLKYIAKHEKVARENRTYIPGEDNDIGRFYHENPIFIANKINEYLEIPPEYQETAKKLYKIQQNKSQVNDEQYNKLKKHCLDQDQEFVKWYKDEPLKKEMSIFITGKKLVRQYLLDDLYETEQVDELYNQSSFMLSKIVPTTYDRICTMGTASIWNLLLAAWSHDKDLAVPDSDVNKNFSGGLARCYKTGYTKKLGKIDYASLYPMLQLTWDIFPIFDISGVMKKMLIYMTTTRNIYKKLGKSDTLNEEEVVLLKGIDYETYVKYINGTLTTKERSMFDIKQLPIKILNNSQFGALGSGISFNWSDNACAARITCCGRLELRHAISWFNQFGLIPLLAVTDGVNFQFPDTTKIRITDDGTSNEENEGPIEEMWQYNGKNGIGALIEKFNAEEMVGYMSVDDDGEFISCLNLSRINYALLEEKKDKKTGELKKKIKLTGNTIKSKVLPEYIEEFIDNGLNLILEGRGSEFVEYYYSYAEDIYYKRIPLKKIASKSKYKNTLTQYLKRGKDKNGREKGKQAHMELVLNERLSEAEKLFEKYKDQVEFKKDEDKLTPIEKLKLMEVYMSPEPELDSVLYYFNTGYRKSHGDSSLIKDVETGEERFASTLISSQELIENPNMTGDYNVDKYLDSFNKRVSTILVGFDPEIIKKIPVKIKRVKKKNEFGKKVEVETLERNHFTSEELKLKNFDKDDLFESMYLEEKEVEFWNETGFDPRLVWNGFKTREDMPVHYEIYQNALDFLNENMKKVGKSLIKSRNEKINKGDYVLLKNGPIYSVGYNNGEYIEILRENVKIPRSKIELELDEKNKKRDEEINSLKSGNNESIIEKEERKKIRDKRLNNFKSFKKKFNVEENTLDEFINVTLDIGEKLIDAYIKDIEDQIEDDSKFYGGDDIY